MEQMSKLTIGESTYEVVDAQARVAVDNLSEDVDTLKDATSIAYATCETAAATAEKAVTVDNENWELKVGVVVMVKFTTSNSASNVKLNVNGTGAYPIWYNNAEYTSTGRAYTGYANRVIGYMFNGTHWVWIMQSYDANTIYTNVGLGHGYANCTTAESTKEKVGTLPNYTLTEGGIVAVKFKYLVPAGATLKINSTGTKAIYYKGSAITGGIIKAGDTATFIYNGSQYHLLSIDRWQSDIDSLLEAINGLQPKGDYLTEVPSEYVTDAELNAKGYLTEHQDLTDYAKKTEIPTKTSQLTNDSGFLTQHQDLSSYAKKTDIPSVPTKTSQLTNDSGFLTAVPSGYAKTTDHYTKTEADNKYQPKGNYLTAVPSGYAKTTDHYTKTEADNKYQPKGNYLTAVPSEYVTETELSGKGYASQTEVTNLSKEIVNLQPKGNYALKSDIDGLSLGIGEDGRIYLLRNGVAQGNGVELPVGETGDVIGNIGENNIIMLNGDIADGTYTVKYEMENGTVINIGNMVLDSNVYYSITNNLTNCTINNSTTKVIENNSYSATITPKSGYKLSSVTVTMGGTNITSSSVSGGTINIAKVTGAIVITATAVEDVPAYTNLADPTSADWWNNAYFGSDGTKRTSADPYVCTNYIGPLNVGDVVRIKNLNCNGTAAGYKCVPYKSDKTIHGSYGVAGLTGFNGNAASNVTVTGTTAQFTNAKSDVKYWRIGGKLTGTANDVIITINEPID